MGLFISLAFFHLDQFFYFKFIFKIETLYCFLLPIPEILYERMGFLLLLIFYIFKYISYFYIFKIRLLCYVYNVYKRKGVAP